ncbi:O-antigen ligase family protein [Luteimonas sp. A478]
MTNSTTADQAAAAPGWRWSPHFVLAFVALWPAPGYAEGVMVLGALVAISRLLMARFAHGTALLSPQAWALTSVLFCAYWVPELISAIDAVDVQRSLREALVDLRYLPFLWLVASAVANGRGRKITFGGLAVIVALWSVDGLVEAFFGTSPLFFGIDGIKQLLSDRPMCTAEQVMAADRLGGVLGPCNLKLGLVLASLAPFLLFPAAQRFGIGGWVVAAVALGLVVLLAGARASWITYALVLVFSGWNLLGWKRMLVVFAGGAATLVALALVSPQVQERVERTAQLATADESGVDVALSGRLRIWSAALCMVRQSPFNGVGVRGFRAAYPDCDPDPEHLAAWGDGPAFHAHQIVLEVLSETGIIGLLLWLAGAALAWRAWRYADGDARNRARPAMLALAVTVFPLNTHLAFYSTFWGGLTLMLAALYAGSLLGSDEPPAGSEEAR